MSIAPLFAPQSNVDALIDLEIITESVNQFCEGKTAEQVYNALVADGADKTAPMGIVLDWLEKCFPNVAGYLNVVPFIVGNVVKGSDLQISDLYGSGWHVSANLPGNLHDVHENTWFSDATGDPFDEAPIPHDCQRCGNQFGPVKTVQTGDKIEVRNVGALLIGDRWVCPDCDNDELADYLTEAYRAVSAIPAIEGEAF